MAVGPAHQSVVQPARGTRPSNRRQLIIDAATDLFCRRGYANVAMGDVAEAVAIGPSALYRHFRGKQDLLATVVGAAPELTQPPSLFQVEVAKSNPLSFGHCRGCVKGGLLTAEGPQHSSTKGVDTMTATSPPTCSRPVTRTGKALGTDYLLLKEYLTEDERAYLDRTRRFVDEEVPPVINSFFERAEVPVELGRRLGELGPGWRRPAGLRLPADERDRRRVDHDGAQPRRRQRGHTPWRAGGPVDARSIHMLGSEEQKQRWLPAVARGEELGAFALTEPRHGSDSVSLETVARRESDEYVINGAKRWIGNGTLADVVVMWARDAEDLQVKGFLIEKGTSGDEACPIEGKGCLRGAVAGRYRADRCARAGGEPPPRGTELKGRRQGAQGDLRLVRLVGARPCSRRLRHPAQLCPAAYPVRKARPDALRDYCYAAVLLAHRASRRDRGALRHHRGLGKLNNTVKARQVLAEARNLLGGNGLLVENHVIRHMTDIEAVYTFEATETIQTLWVGRDITRLSAFV